VVNFGVKSGILDDENLLLQRIVDRGPQSMDRAVLGKFSIVIPKINTGYLN
jgi:hypothetical protein